MYKKIFIFLLNCIIIQTLYAQYQTNGSAFQTSCNCYTITPNLQSQGGSVWNTNQINLNDSFDYSFEVFLGCEDYIGADGICFALQPISTSVGGLGQGMGLGGISPSLGIFLDTFKNDEDGDPLDGFVGEYDHLSINMNGDVSHLTPNNLAGPVKAHPVNDNIEDCAFHKFRIKWKPSSNLLEVFFDESPRLQLTYDMINDIFSGDTMVYWGFTGATGGNKNEQKFCTSIEAKFANESIVNVCTGEEIVFKDSSVSGIGEINNYQWNAGDGSAPFNGLSSFIYTYQIPGTYIATLEVTDASGCSDMDTIQVNVTQNAQVNIAINPGNSICKGESALLTATGGDTYLWNTGSASDTLTVAPTSDAIYIVEVTDTASNCKSSDSIQVSVLFAPAINISGDTTLCKGGSGVLSDSLAGVFSYLWSTGDTTQSITISPDTNVTYFLTVTFGSCSSTDSIDVTVVDGPVLNIAANPGNSICKGESALLTATGGDTYLWNTGSASDTLTVAPTSDAIYIVEVTDTASNCKSSDSIQVSVLFAPAINISGDTTLCKGGSGVLSDSLAGVFSYLWSSGDTTQSITISPDTNVTYFLTVTSGSCSSTDSIDVTVVDGPVLNIAASPGNSICKGESALLTATGGDTYLWNTGSASDTLTVAPTSDAIYIVEVTDTASNCKSSDSIQVSVLFAPAINISGDTALCKGGSGVLSDSLAGVFSYLWSSGDTTQSITISPDTNVTYFLTVTSGSCSSTDSINVNVNANPVLNIAANPNDSITMGESVTIAASGTTSFVWSPSDGLNSTTGASVIATPSSTSTYLVTGTNLSGCSTTDSITIFVDISCGEIFVPNVFSPNNDYVNDYLKVENNCIEEMVLKIFDRWGEMVFETTNQNVGWDGAYKGKKLDTGVFVYTLTVKLINSPNIIKMKGNVTLLNK